MLEAAVGLGGTLTGEHGIGIFKREHVPLGIDGQRVGLDGRRQGAVRSERHHEPGQEAAGLTGGYVTTAPKLSSRLARCPRWISLLVLGLAASLLYIEAVNFGLFNDDPTGNFAWLDGHSLFDLFGSASGYGFYRPAGFAIWKVLFYLFGSHNAVALHAVSILLHGVNTVAVWLLAHRLVRRPGYAWMAAVIFACAPLSYEAVAYVAALFHPLLTFWIIATILFYDRGRQQRRNRYLVLSFACLITALFTHENGVVLVPLLLAWELLFGNQIGRRQAIWFLAIGFAATGAFLVLWARMQDSISGRAHPLSEILANTLPFLQAIAAPVLPYIRLTVEHSAWLVFIAIAASGVGGRGCSRRRGRQGLCVRADMVCCHGHAFDFLPAERLCARWSAPVLPHMGGCCASLVDSCLSRSGAS